MDKSKRTKRTKHLDACTIGTVPSTDHPVHYAVCAYPASVMSRVQRYSSDAGFKSEIDCSGLTDRLMEAWRKKKKKSRLAAAFRYRASELRLRPWQHQPQNMPWFPYRSMTASLLSLTFDLGHSESIFSHLSHWHLPYVERS